MKTSIVPKSVIHKRILLIRGKNVMLDTDLAELYGVYTKVLNQAVKRNIKRFPEDFMFKLTKSEKEEVVTNCDHLKSIKFSPQLPYAFSEQGVAMLSSVLKSDRAIQVNIGIMRVFVNIKRIVASNRIIAGRLEKIEGKIKSHDKKIKTIFQVIHKPQTALISPKSPFTNRKIIWDIIKSCNGYIYWLDKYFTKAGLELLLEIKENRTVRRVKILTSVDKVDEKLKESFRYFKKEIRNNGINCELRVLIDNRTKSKIHDRWLISKNVIYNLPSIDTIARGQYSEVKETKNRPPFDEWWKNSKDITKDWNVIEKLLPSK